jgi:predicted kinase
MCFARNLMGYLHAKYGKALYHVWFTLFSGKTTLQKEVMKRLRCQVVSVDRIMDEKDRWRQGHPIQEDWNAAYSEAYRQMKECLKEGKTVIFDCANLPFHERENARKIADGLGVTYQLMYVKAPKHEGRDGTSTSRRKALAASPGSRRLGTGVSAPAG